MCLFHHDILFPILFFQLCQSCDFMRELMMWLINRKYWVMNMNIILVSGKVTLLLSLECNANHFVGGGMTAAYLSVVQQHFFFPYTQFITPDADFFLMLNLYTALFYWSESVITTDYRAQRPKLCFYSHLKFLYPL